MQQFNMESGYISTWWRLQSNYSLIGYPFRISIECDCLFESFIFTYWHPMLMRWPGCLPLVDRVFGVSRLLLVRMARYSARAIWILITLRLLHVDRLHHSVNLYAPLYWIKISKSNYDNQTFSWGVQNFFWQITQ